MTAYEILHTTERATSEQLKTAFKGAAFAARQRCDTAPDAPRRAQAEEDLRLILRAWDLLKTPELRATYDARLSRMRAGGGDPLGRLAAVLGGAAAVCDGARRTVEDPRVRRVEQAASSLRDALAEVKAALLGAS